MLSRDERIYAAGQSDVLSREAQREGWRRTEGEIQRLSRQRLPVEPVEKVRCLEPFTLGGGRIAEVGEVVALPRSEARNAIAIGRAERV